MRTLLWALVVVALEVLLISGYEVLLISGHSGVLEMGYLASTNEELLALLVGTVSVVVWLSFASGFEQTWRRLLLTIIGCIVLTYAALVVVFVDLPTAVVCERGRTEVDADPHILGGRFEERRVGPCVFYNPESRPVAGLRGSGD